MENLCCHLFFLYFKVNNVPIWERFIEFCCINFKFISQKSDLFLCKDSVVLMDNGYLTTVVITIFLLAHGFYIPERNGYSLLSDLQKIHIDYSIQKKTCIACQFVLVEFDLSYLLKHNLMFLLCSRSSNENLHGNPPHSAQARQINLKSDN